MRPMTGAVLCVLMMAPALAQTANPGGEALAPSGGQTVAKSAIPLLPTKLQGRWVAVRLDPYQSVGSTTSINVTAQIDGKVVGTYTMYPRNVGTDQCRWVVDWPFEGTWDGTTLALVAKKPSKSPDCEDRRATLTRAQDHFLEERRASDSYYVYYDPVR